MAGFIGDSGKVLRQEVKQLMKEIIARTPPQGGTSRVGQFETIDVGAKRQGELALAKDLRGIFDVIPDGMHAKLIARNPGVREMKIYLSDSTKFVVDRDFFAQNVGQMRAFHKRMRSPSTGRTPRFKAHRSQELGRNKARDRMVVSKSLYEAYRAECWKQIGQQKGGWGEAAKLLGVNLPSWIARHASGKNGFVRPDFENKESPSVTVGNTTPGAVTNCRRIVQYALENRARFMARNLARFIKYGPGKSGDYGYARE